MKRLETALYVTAYAVGLGVVAVWWAKGAALKVRDRWA